MNKGSALSFSAVKQFCGTVKEINMIRAHEMNNNGRDYWVEDTHRGNGLAVGALATAIPAAVISLGNFAKEWLGNNGGNTAAGNVANFCAAMVPALSGLLGRTVNASTCLSPAEVKIAEQAAKIAMLEAENYSDRGVADLNKAITQGQKEQFEYSLGLERRLGVLEGENKCLQQRFADYKESQAEKAKLEKEVMEGKINRVADSVACLADKVDGNAQAINATNARISAITKVVVPGEVVCGDRCSKCNGGNGNQQ